MPLTTRTPGTSPIDSSAVNQYYQALTGGMVDQPFTLANTLTVTNGITASSQMNVAKQASFSSAIVVTGTIDGLGLVVARGNSCTAQTLAFMLGSSGPGLLFGASTPTASAIPGSLFLNAGGSSTQVLYVAMPNGGGASSSNWSPVTLG